MKALTGQELTRLLVQHGWALLRIAGSHYIYGKQGTKVHLSVPVHGHATLKTGLLRHLLKLAGIPEGEA